VPPWIKRRRRLSTVQNVVGPVELPEYLDRPQIMTCESRNELQFAEFDRWAGSLEKAFSRVLAVNLSILLSTDRVAVYPWKTTPIDHQVAEYDSF